MVAMMEHTLAITLQLDLNLPVDKLQESMLIHLIVKVIRLISALLKPRPWHLQLVVEVVAWV